MTAVSAAYLVIRRDDGFGDVFPLMGGQRYTMGRAGTNRIVLKDDLCSREHAEVYQLENRWCVRDLNSLNGTRINGQRLENEWEMSPGDEVLLGRTNLLFIEDLAQLPELPIQPAPAEQVSIKKRLSKSRFLTPTGPKTEDDIDIVTPQRRDLGMALAVLYRIALDMGSAETLQELARSVLEGVLDGVLADAGAVISVKEGKEFDLIAHKHRDPEAPTYVKISQFVSNEVLLSKEAILAEDVSRDQHLKNRESLADLSASSLICAPAIFNDRVLGLIHLYCTDPKKALDADDLEFAIAVAKQLGAAMNQLQIQASLTAENKSLRTQLRVESELIGGSPAMKHVESQIARVAPTSASVLVRGESGTGKELVARAIHYNSNRREGPFICINCAALPETLLESELFGHEKGAFTGATERKIGKFEAADNGTIFLDEIGEMNPGTQAKLLRILEGHSFERVGGHATIRVDVRVVSATNQPLEMALQQGTFRRDLFYRLQVIEIRIVPLRDRSGDIPLLAEHFLKRFVRETGRRISGFSAAAVKRLEEYTWPGNVRELRNVVERAVALGSGPMLDAQDILLFPTDVVASPIPTETSNDYRPVDLEEVEKNHILRTLQYTDWNKSQASSILKIERSTLDRKIKAFDLKR